MIFARTLVRTPRTSRTGFLRTLSFLGLFSLVAAAMVCPARSQADVTIDFENLPSLATQPSDFNSAGAMQTYSLPGVFTISGGVVIGDPNFLTPFATHGSGHNAYGTADFADPSLQSTLLLTLPSAESVTGVSGVLFNGQPIAETYTVTYMSGATTLGTNTFTNMADDSSASAFGNFSLTSTAANPITSVAITTPNGDINGWDFFVDTIDLTTSPASDTPEPGSTALLIGLSLSGVAVLRRRSRRSDRE